jgi:hypothetical protein
LGLPKARPEGCVRSALIGCGTRADEPAMATELTRELIEQAFDRMGAIAARRGLVIEIAVYGGSCLVLASDVRNASADVDAVFLINRSAVYEIADAVAREMGFAPNWINEAVRQTAPPIGNPQPNLFPFGEYPRGRQAATGLRVHVPAPAYLLAMKVLANRLDAETLKVQSDRDDAVALMKITGIVSREGIIELLKQCYPNIPGILEPKLNPRISTKIDSLMDAYVQSSQSVDPSWHAGTGPATRPQ